jgi:hypothetical protein
MSTYVKWFIAAVILSLAVYGAFRIISDRLDSADGKKAVETAHPFVQGATSAAGEKLKQTLKETPDAKLEEDSELLSRKLYPVVKGSVKGQLDAILNDPNRSELPEKMVQTGKELAENVIKPLTEGVAQGSQKVLEDMDKGFQELRKFQEKNKDIIEGLQSGIKAIQQHLDGSTQSVKPQNPEDSNNRVSPNPSAR